MKYTAMFEQGCFLNSVKSVMLGIMGAAKTHFFKLLM